MNLQALLANPAHESFEQHEYNTMTMADLKNICVFSAGACAPRALCAVLPLMKGVAHAGQLCAFGRVVFARVFFPSRKDRYNPTEACTIVCVERQWIRGSRLRFIVVYILRGQVSEGVMVVCGGGARPNSPQRSEAIAIKKRSRRGLGGHESSSNPICSRGVSFGQSTDELECREYRGFPFWMIQRFGRSFVRFFCRSIK
jgi:hypothetical protein